jgi:hypothetical protein
VNAEEEGGKLSVTFSENAKPFNNIIHREIPAGGGGSL